MEAFQKKTVKTSRGLTYTYYVSPESDNYDKSLPALLYSHGWPDHAKMWASIATSLRKLPFRQVIPDLLGYDGTSKPTDPESYKYDVLTKDIMDILDAEGIQNCISIGHDWGSVVAARVYNYYPSRVNGLILFNVGYLPPAHDKFNLDAVNAYTAASPAFGYPVYEYWYLFAAPDGAQLLQDNLDRLYSALHAKGATAMQRFFCTPNVFRDYLTTTTEPDVEVRDYAKDAGFKQEFLDRMRRDGFEGPQNYYISFKDNLQYECDKELPEGNSKVNVPVLYVGCTEDAVCTPAGMVPAIQAGLLPDLESTPMVTSGHWSPYEKPDELAGYVTEWLQIRFVNGPK